MASSLSLHVLSDLHGRCFENPFFTDPSGIAQSVTREWLTQSVTSVAKRVTEEPMNYDEDGPYVGPSGIAYALFRMAKATTDTQQLHDHIHTILKRTAKTAKEASKSHERRYLTGTLGFYIVRGIAEWDLETHRPGNLDTETKALFNKLFERVLKPGGDDEMMNGRAGFLGALLEIRFQLGKDILSTDQVAQLLRAVVTSGRSYAKRHKSSATLMFEWHDSEYLGAAHGICGIYQMLLSFWTLLDAEAKADLKQSIDWLLSIQEPDGNFPSSSHHIGEPSKLVHWCHGAPGVLHMLIAAYLVYNESAEKCANVIWTKGLLRKGPGLCHGVAGNGYAFLLLYRLTHNADYLAKAKAFAYVMMSASFQNSAGLAPDSPYSLFEGWSGALCFLVDLLNPDQAQFPLIPICFK